MSNSFDALPSVDEVGAAMELTEVVQDGDIDGVDNPEDYHNEEASGSMEPGIPTTARHKKKHTKMKHSGSHPKGRHKS